jgi:arylsulfatase A-like enzyme/Tfp pilus assembly protein PilF
VARPLRHGFILATIALCTLLAAAGGWRYARASSPVNGPIILISIDSQRADRLSAYGHTPDETPAIDALAADGVVFEHAYAHSPETLPSHASMLSGRLPVETGVRDDQGFVVKDSERLLAELLRDRGYSTGAVVSTFALRKDSGIAQGFMQFNDNLSSDGSANVAQGFSPATSSTGVTRDGADAERAAEKWLDSTNLSRSFLFLQIGHDGADEAVASLVRYLKSHQLYDRSTILLTASHGEGLGDHGEQASGLFVYEESLRVPLIVKQAAGEGAGRRVADMVQHVDLVPTLLDLAKAPDPGGLHGQSLKPLLDNAGQFPVRIAYAESLYGRYHFGWHELTTVSDGRYRYVRALRDELYDLKADAAEQRNIAADPTSAPILNSLRLSLDRMKGGQPPPPSPVSETDRERFEELGVVGRAPAEEPGAATERPDPKDMVQVLETYRAAVGFAAVRQWARAIDALQSLVRENPDFADAWREMAGFALDANRNEQAVDAYKHVIALQPDDVDAQLAATRALVRLRRYDEARQHAEAALATADAKDVQSRSSAHEWLARIALARRDAETAHDEADLSREADPALPLPQYVDGRVLYDRGKYADALPLFEQAVKAEKAAHSRAIADLHFSLADTLMRLDRNEEAEVELDAELKAFPGSTRARAALATLQHAAGRDEEAAETIEELVRLSPTPDSYTIAARLWTTLGNKKRAAEAHSAALTH